MLHGQFGTKFWHELILGMDELLLQKHWCGFGGQEQQQIGDGPDGGLQQQGIMSALKMDSYIYHMKHNFFKFRLNKNLINVCFFYLRLILLS